jgi:hypothetical protein
MAPHEEKAGQIADAFLKRGLPRGSRYFNEDDRMCAHYVYDWLEACRDFHPVRPPDINERENFTRYFPRRRFSSRRRTRTTRAEPGQGRRDEGL